MTRLAARHFAQSSVVRSSTVALLAAFASLVACSSDDAGDDSGGTGGQGARGGSTASGSGATGGTGAVGSGGTASTTGGTGTPIGSGGTAAGGAGVAGGGAAAGGAVSGGAPATGGGGAGGSSGGVPSAGGAAGGSGGTGGTSGGTGGATGGAGGSGGTGVIPPVTEVWVSPTGVDTNPGTAAAPMQTICNTETKVGACYKLCRSSYSCPATGATIWVKGGTYKITSKIDIGATRPGVAGGIMKLFAVAGEKPIIDASGLPKADVTKTGIALHLKGSYWHVKGLEIMNAPHNCVKVEGGFDTIEQVVVHGCGNTGITLAAYGGEDMSASPGSNNLVLNSDSYGNVGANNNGEDADGFGAKEQKGKNNIFRGCRAWNNADDGFDLYGWGDPITIEDSWALESGKMGASGGDGNGFKLGKGPGNHIVKNAIAAHNVKRGFTSNGADNQSTCTNCRGCDNTEGLNDTGDRSVLGSVANLSPCLDAAKAKSARGANGALPAL